MRPAILLPRIGLGLAYFVSGKIGLSLAQIHPSATAVWPPSGISLAALLLLGIEAWPAIFAGAFLVNITTAGDLLTSLSIASGNTLEAVLGCLLVKRWAGGVSAFENPLSISRFTLSAALACSASATLGVSSLCLRGYALWPRFGSIWLTWWLGDLTGALLIVPCAILWALHPRAHWSRGQAAEGLVSLALLGIACKIVFGTWYPWEAAPAPLSFLYLPPLIWIASRFSPRDAATTCLFMACAALYGTLKGRGIFGLAQAGPNALLLLQSFLAICSQTVLMLSASITQLKDMNRLKLAEQLLEKKTQELSSANAELSLYASMVSHELQEPLRKILAFGDMLTTSSQGLSEESRHHAARMRESAQRMQRLVEDILNLARITTTTRPLVPVNLGAVLKDVAEDFEPLLSSTGGSIEVTPGLPEIKADESLMHQLFYNLFSNAWKFRKNDAPPRIAVSCRKPSGGFVEIEVADNGIGFDERYLDKIFKPFQRLHPKGAYPGSGMGLAISERILLRHGGNITAKSAPGKGSRFIVTLPA